MTPTVIGVLASGRGSNFEALARNFRNGTTGGLVRVVIANVPDAAVLERAKALGVEGKLIDHKTFASRADFERALIEELEKYNVGLVCLAGFMRILSPVFVNHFAGRIMNIHPSLLPAFAGLQGMDVHRAVLESGAQFTGCTVHFVNEHVDAGPIILQRVVPVLDDDTVETLAARVLAEEHQAYPEAVKLFCQNRLQIQGRRVKII